MYCLSINHESKCKDQNDHEKSQTPIHANTTKKIPNSNTTKKNLIIFWDFAFGIYFGFCSIWILDLYFIKSMIGRDMYPGRILGRDMYPVV